MRNESSFVRNECAWNYAILARIFTIVVLDVHARGQASGEAESGRAGARGRRFVMIPPEHFDVVYSINPWMWPGEPVDRALAITQWERLVATYQALGHTVDVVEPAPGLPDMVFVANSALVIGGRVLAARFRHAERRGEEPHHRAWFRDRGFADVRVTRHVSEGEGDFAPCGDVLLAGFGFRTERAAHADAAAIFDRRVVSLELVDPRFYHLDTALAVLDGSNIMYLPSAFSMSSRRTLRRLFPGAIEANEGDASVMGLNAVSDGAHVVLPVEAKDLAARLRRRGFEPVAVEISELRKAGGGVKCCTLELHP